ncbi:beta-galactosidase [Fusarium albosuccineum]|uniref:Beta-galactosidase n=1 Tax=Fusarium albosuccineum TaxID=1237068 RepID=A0A8H4L916_9HYPO|nr:beta-galactosidase [Fusarium albosuccineum]
MSHHPAAPALLEACDEIGLYVVDEFADTWFYPKTSHDDSGSFHEEWKDDLAAMICKDRNHPSVIMYSLGNEVTEPETAYGQALAKTILDYQKSLDPTRPNTIAINLMLAVLKFSRTPPGSPDTRPPTPSPLVGNVGSSLINQLANFFTPLAMTLVKLKQCDLVTKELFSFMDIAGYNYGTDRYLCDSTSYPERLVLGSETFPCDIARNWDLVERVPNLIGDFMWVGWDYLGETGIGGFDYNVPWWSPGRFYKSFPYLTAGTGALDITGVEGSVALVAKAAWKLLHQPVVTVRPLNISHISYRTTLWRRTDAVPGWAWKNCEGKKAYVEVISQQEEIELLLNGRSLGRSKGGLANNYTARFTVAYEPGALLAIGYSGGREVSRSIVRSAGPAMIRAVNERFGSLAANGQDLAFIRLELADQNGVVEMNDDDKVQVEVEGPATLAGLGNGCFETQERFDDNVHSTYQGRALVVVRSGMKTGEVIVKVSTEKHGSITVAIKQT